MHYADVKPDQGVAAMLYANGAKPMHGLYSLVMQSQVNQTEMCGRL